MIDFLLVVSSKPLNGISTTEPREHELISVKLYDTKTVCFNCSAFYDFHGWKF